MEFFPNPDNGQVDRAALPEPNVERADFATPQTELEQTIFNIWREVTGAEQIGVNDNFFDVGGSSIRLVEAHSKLTRALRRPLSVTALFQYPTIRALAKFLSAEPTAHSAAQTI